MKMSRDFTTGISARLVPARVRGRQSHFAGTIFIPAITVNRGKTKRRGTGRVHGAINRNRF